LTLIQSLQSIFITHIIFLLSEEENNFFLLRQGANINYSATLQMQFVSCFEMMIEHTLWPVFKTCTVPDLILKAGYFF